jgi:precorrin-6B methylase 2
MKIRLRPVVRSLRQHGVSATVAHAVYRMSESYYERRLAIDTSAAMTLPEHTGDHNNYVASDYGTLRTAFKLVRPSFADAVLLDYGAGMGRVLAFAGLYPFRRVIGIELCPVLSGIARDNIERARRHFRCRHVEVVTGNATTYEVPTDVTLVYLFNPFRGETLREVLRRLHESLERSPRDVVIICKQSINMEAEEARLPWIQRVREFRCHDGHLVTIYNASATAQHLRLQTGVGRTARSAVR